jgi:hypothetical protein
MALDYGRIYEVRVRENAAAAAAARAEDERVARIDDLEDDDAPVSSGQLVELARNLARVEQIASTEAERANRAMLQIKTMVKRLETLEARLPGGGNEDDPEGGTLLEHVVRIDERLTTMERAGHIDAVRHNTEEQQYHHRLDELITMMQSQEQRLRMMEDKLAKLEAFVTSKEAHNA